MSFILNPAGLVIYEFVLDNIQLQNIIGGNPIVLQSGTGRPFAIVAASMLYRNATIQFETVPGAGSAIILVESSVAAYYQSANTSTFSLLPNYAMSYQVNYDLSGPLFTDPYNGDKLAILFDSDYSTGDGELLIKIFGFYF
jgi:hypothetical protein